MAASAAAVPAALAKAAATAGASGSRTIAAPIPQTSVAKVIVSGKRWKRASTSAPASVSAPSAMEAIVNDHGRVAAETMAMAAVPARTNAQLGRGSSSSLVNISK